MCWPPPRFVLPVVLALSCKIISVIASETLEELNSEKTFDYRQKDPEAIRPHYALDPRKSKRLALLEEVLVGSLKTIVSSPYCECVRNLREYIAEYEEDSGDPVQGEVGVLRTKVVTENPILTFKMVRRIVITLLNGTCVITRQCNVAKVVGDTFTAANLSLPTEQDLKDAILGLLRIQYIYGFNASQLRHGSFNGIETNARLNFQDCLALAKKALELEGDSIAYQWLTSAEAIANKMDEKAKHELELTWRSLMELVKVETRDELQVRLQNKQQEILKSFAPVKYYTACREGLENQEKRRPSTFYCFNQKYWHPYFYINPVKTEILFENPPVLHFYDFVSEKAIDRLWWHTSEYLIRSGGSSKKAYHVEFGDFRTSMSCMYEDMWTNKRDPILVNLNRRIEKLTGMELVKNYSSQLQMVLYGGVGGHTDFHLDSLQDTLDPYDEGDRLATFLMFISDVSLGGYTAFYKLGIHAKPIKGSAIFWFNLLRNGKPDKRALHAGCPVILGTKKVANRWIYEHENMWNTPCSTIPNA